ncbi:MAG: DoxX family protein [Methylobacteriaceae bacterium]|nr:DoxX family protein [Methylobacteriaceae bacterium]
MNRDVLIPRAARAPGALVARLLLSGLFLQEGALLAAHPDAALDAMGRLGVPHPLGAAAIALQVGGGVAVAFGLGTRVAAGALGLFCLATAALFHTRFAVRNELLHFEKDLALAGGLFLLALHGGGALSLDRLLRARGARAAGPRSAAACEPTLAVPDPPPITGSS